MKGFKKCILILATIGICSYPFVILHQVRMQKESRIESNSKKGMLLSNKVDEEQKEIKAYRNEEKNADSEIKKADNKTSIETVAIDPMQDGIWLGDSRVVKLSAYNYIGESKNLAVNDSTILDVDNQLDKIKNEEKNRVYIEYGVQDVIHSLGNGNAKKYRKIVEKQIHKILSVKPNAEIYLNSIIPVNPSYAEKYPFTHWISHYNRELKKMCEENQWHYLDNDGWTEKGFADIYEDDGVTLKNETYSLWIQSMKNGV